MRFRAAPILVPVMLVGALARAQPPVVDAPEEPATVHAADPWFDRAWQHHNASLLGLPEETTARLQQNHARSHGWVTHGVGALPGVPGAARSLRAGLGDSAAHMQAAADIPARASEARTPLTEGAADTAQAHRDAAVKTQRAWEASAEVAVVAPAAVHAVAASAHAQGASQREKQRDHARAQHGRANTVAEEGAVSSVEALRGLPRVATEARRAHAALMTTQAPRTLIQWSAGQASEALGAMPGRVAQVHQDGVRMAVNTLASGRAARRDVVARTQVALSADAEHTAAALERSRGEHARQERAWEEQLEQSRRQGGEHLVARARANHQHTLEATRADAAAEWNRGLNTYLRGGIVLAGDNHFAGDAEGHLLSAHYAASALAMGGGTLAVVAPLSVVGNVGAGGLQAGALLAEAAGKFTLLTAVTVGSRVGLALHRAGDLGATAVAGAGRFGVHLLGGKAAEAGVALGTAAWLGVTTVGTGLHLAAGAVAAPLGWALVAGGVGAAGVLTWALLQPAAHGVVAAGHTAWAARVGGDAGATLGLGLLEGGARHAVAAGLVVLGDAGSRSVEGLQVSAAAALAGLNVLAATGSAALQTGWWWAVATPLRTAMALGGASARSAWSLVRHPLGAALPVPLAVAGFALTVGAVGGAAALGWVLGDAWTGARTAAAGAWHGAGALGSGAVRQADAATAPFHLDRLLAWRQERLPQLAAMLERQEPPVRSRVGTQVEYVRVVATGVDRGKVLFFDVKDAQGRSVRLRRAVGADCAVRFVGSDVTVESGFRDGRCAARAQGGQP